MDIVSSELPGSPTTRIQVSNKLPVSFSNGVLKRNHHTAFNSNNQSGGGGSEVFVYKECLKNHAASLGSHAVDGCGEFMPSPNCNSADPTSFKCAACGCHRNFHRREEPDDVLINNTPLLEYQPHHRHHPPPPPPPQPQNGGGGGGDGGSHSSPSSESPPPISSSYYPSAPHLLLTLSGGGGGGGMSQEQIITPVVAPVGYQSNGRKRFRTRFTSDQKGKMLELAEKLGWKMQRRDDGLINGVCNDIGVERGVFKVWMHNNKSNFGKSSCNSIPSSSGNNNTTNSGNNNNTMNHHGSLNEKENNNNNNQQGNDGSFSGRVIGANGSSTSS